MSSWHSPQSIFQIGHRAVKDLFASPVQLQEKVDGSFFAFGLYPEPSQNDEVVLKVRSKGAVMVPDAPMAMFRTAVEGVVSRQSLLHPGWQYRGECVAKPKHNALSYDRTPKDFVILFDILTDEEDYLPYPELKAEAHRLGYEVVPQLFEGMINSAEEFRGWLDTVSILGGQKIEGVVAKPLSPMFGQDKKLLMAKFVSEAYKEVHSKAWGESNPTSGDILDKLGKMYGTQARWDKAIQHMKEAGKIEGRVQDIGPIIQEIPKDVGIECKDEIKQYLWKWAWPHVQRTIIRGFPDYYKELLLRQQFEDESEAQAASNVEGGVDGVNLGVVGVDIAVVSQEGQVEVKGV